MPRQAKLRQKDGYWATDAKGTTTRFGRVDEVPYAVALKKFHEFLVITPEEPQAKLLCVRELADQFLTWVLTHRGQKAHAERTRHIDRFTGFFGGLSVATIKATHLENFLEHLNASHYAADYVEKHVVSIKAMFAKGIRKGWIPSTIRPFDGLEPIRKVPKALTEAKLPTDAEINALFDAAEGQMADMLRIYHATGARTGELIAARAGDFQRVNRQIILAKHKRSHTLRVPVPRTITLNAVAFEILVRRTEGLAPEDCIFPRPRDGQPHSNLNLAMRFKTVRRRAKVRESITCYSFRHLWISEALMAGVDLLLVARMSGTGIKMIESVYGHFRSQSYHEAQARLDIARTARLAKP